MPRFVQPTASTLVLICLAYTALVTSTAWPAVPAAPTGHTLPVLA